MVSHHLLNIWLRERDKRISPSSNLRKSTQCFARVFWDLLRRSFFKPFASVGERLYVIRVQPAVFTEGNILLNTTCQAACLGTAQSHHKWTLNVDQRAHNMRSQTYGKERDAFVLSNWEISSLSRTRPMQTLVY